MADLFVLAVKVAALPGWFLTAYVAVVLVVFAAAAWTLAHAHQPANDRCACGHEQDGRR